MQNKIQELLEKHKLNLEVRLRDVLNEHNEKLLEKYHAEAEILEIIKSTRDKMLEDDNIDKKLVDSLSREALQEMLEDLYNRKDIEI